MITYLKLGRYGRFGNQLFEIAGTIGLAIKHGYKFGFPEWKNYDHLERFKSDEDINVQDYFIHPLPVVGPGHYPEFAIPWGYHDVKLPDNVSIWGHMQCEKYFKHCAELIRYYFEMKKVTNYKVPDNAICIHCRFGDYDGNYHTILGMDYYEKALDLFSCHDKILIFSDEPKKAYNMFGWSIEHIQVNHYMVDFYLMRQCKYFIISNSTIPWWAAWLSSSEKVIASKNWFGPACKVRPDDIYPENWIII